MTTIKSYLLGAIGLRDLAQLVTAVGLDGLPYPLDIATAAPAQHTSSALAPDELAAFGGWVQRYRTADLRVTVRTFPSHDSVAEARIVAFRRGAVGYLATQHDDAVDISRIGAEDLAPAITAALPLTKPGPHSEVVVPRYVGYFEALGATPVPTAQTGVDTTPALLVPVRAQTSPFTVVPDDDIHAVTVVQSSFKPAANWGIDWAKATAVAIHTDSGEYCYTADYTRATPVDAAGLTYRINQLIAADIRAIREQRD